jgi:electron transfer flavoprotein beta subunit
VTVVAAGSPKLKETIKEALAMGADEAIILIDPVFQDSDTTGSARLLAKTITKIGRYDLILLGDGSTDNYSSEIPSRLAELLDLPQIGSVREIEALNGKVKVTRDLEEVLEVLVVDLPAVIAVTSELNTPRLPPLSAILKAGRKPLHQWGPEEISISTHEVGVAASVVELLSNLLPIQDRKNIIFEDPMKGVGELVKALQTEGILQE